MTRLHLMTWSLERSPVKSRLSRVPWSRSPRAPPIGAFYTGVLLAALSIGSLAGCTQCTALRPDNYAALRQARAQTNQYCNPLPGSPLWVLALVAKSSRSSDRCLLHWRPPCGALDLFLGRLFLPHWRCPQSALGPVVSLAPSADRCLNPSFLPGCCPPSQASLLH